MSEVATRLLLPLFVLMCLILGGSNQGVWLPAILQMTAALLIGFMAFTTTGGGLSKASRLLLCLVGAALLLAIVQLVPVSPEWWTQYPGRGPVEGGYKAMGLALPWLPISLTPHGTLQTSFFALPFLAVLLGMIVARQVEPGWLVAALVIGTAANIGLGAVQTAGGESWKVYSITNTGAVGFFANRNFLGTLLVVNIPFAMALMGSANRTDRHAKMTIRVVGAAYLVVLLVSIVLNGSLAVAVIAVPVLAAGLALLPSKLSRKWYSVAIVGLLLAGAAILLKSGQVGLEGAGSDTVSFQTRLAIWSQTTKIVGDTFPFGTGLGSFREIFAFYEDPALIDRFYVNNVHNDYLELILEAGLPGILLIIAFFAWWIVQVKRVWGSPHVRSIPRAATIASAAILTHSLVDYPLRTAAISAIFALCLGAMATSGRSSALSVHPSDRHARHVRIA